MNDRGDRGAFIVVEGLDGAGTTTQVRLLSAHLRSIGFQTWTTREPSGGAIGQALRGAIEGRESMTPEALALGFAADRLHHMLKPGGIESMLADGVWVITDRYVLSALAYQAAQGVDLEWLVELNKHAPTPDLTVFVDTPLSICLARIKARGDNVEDMFHRRAALINTRRQYLRALSLGVFVGRLVTADGRGKPAEVLNQILRGLNEEMHSDFGLFSLLLPGPPVRRGGRPPFRKAFTKP
jgi:dTMP kinase